MTGDSTSATTVWPTATDPAAMLALCMGRLSDRKLRLYLVGCCRRRSGFFDRASARAIDVAERYADGIGSAGFLFAAGRAAMPAHERSGQQRLLTAAAAAVCLTRAELDRATPSGPYAAEIPALIAAARGARMRQTRGGGAIMAEIAANAETADLAKLLRCVAGDPFVHVVLDPRWQTTAVVDIAQSIYESRDFAPLPILADALEDAGCEDATLLEHCRHDTIHARGCRVIDAILGKI